MLSGELVELVVPYETWIPDEISVSKSTVTEGNLVGLIEIVMDTEEMTVSQSIIVSGTLERVLVIYDNWETEEMSVSKSTITSGTLS